MKLATLVYIYSEGKTLMVYRDKKPNDMHRGKWNGLGGKIEPGETPQECAMREVREESGLEIRNPHLHGLLMFPDFFGDDWYVFVFTATDFNGSLIDSPEGRLEWIGEAELAQLPLWESDRIFFAWLKQDRFFTAKFLFKGGKLIDHAVDFY